MPNAAPLKRDPYRWWSITCPRCGEPIYAMQDMQDFEDLGEHRGLWVCPHQHRNGKFIARRFLDTVVSRAVPMSWVTQLSGR